MKHTRGREIGVRAEAERLVGVLRCANDQHAVHVGDVLKTLLDEWDAERRVVGTALATARAEATAEERAWLIERNVNGYPEWMARMDAHSDDCVISWTQDANLAVRFSRSLDCDRVLPALDGRFGRVFATEHLWLARHPGAAEGGA